MDPINTQERNNALMRFILIFMVTMCVVLFAVFFDDIVKKKSRNDDSVNYRNCKIQLESNDKFLDLMTDISSKMTKVNMASSVMEFEMSVTEFTSSLNAFKENTNKLDTASVQRQFNDKIYSILVNYSIEIGKKKEKIEELTTKNRDLGNELDEKAKAISDLENQLSKCGC
jgi:hypothetical protein